MPDNPSSSNSLNASSQIKQIYGYEIIDEISNNSTAYHTYIGKQEDLYGIIKVAKSYEYDDTLATEAKWFDIDWRSAEVVLSLGNAGALDYAFSCMMLKSFYPGSLLEKRTCAIYEHPKLDFDSSILLSSLHEKIILDARTSARILQSLFTFYGAVELSTLTPPIHHLTFSAHDYLVSPNQQRIVRYGHSGFAQEPANDAIVSTLALFMLDWTVAVANNAYLDLLQNFASNHYENVLEARGVLARLMLGLWGREIISHPFTYRSHKEDSEWKSINKHSLTLITQNQS